MRVSTVCQIMFVKPYTEPELGFWRSKFRDISDSPAAILFCLAQAVRRRRGDQPGLGEGLGVGLITILSIMDAESRHDCKYLSMVSVYANTEHAGSAPHSCYINTKLLGRNGDVDDEIITASIVSI